MLKEPRLSPIFWSYLGVAKGSAIRQKIVNFPDLCREIHTIQSLELWETWARTAVFWKSVSLYLTRLPTLVGRVTLLLYLRQTGITKRRQDKFCTDGAIRTNMRFFSRQGFRGIMKIENKIMYLYAIRAWNHADAL